MAAEPTATAESTPGTDGVLDALFCERGQLRTPTEHGRFTCPCECAASDEQSALDQLTLVYEQQTLEGQRFAPDDALDPESDDEAQLSYTRTAHCSDCDAEQDVSAKVMQTRSADEPPTRHYTCKVCGKSWREDE